MWGFRAVWAGDETKRCQETAPVPRAAFGGAGEKQGALHGRMEVSGSLTGVQMGGGCCWTSGHSVDPLHPTRSVLAAHTAGPRVGQGVGPLPSLGGLRAGSVGTCW